MSEECEGGVWAQAFECELPKICWSVYTQAEFCNPDRIIVHASGTNDTWPAIYDAELDQHLERSLGVEIVVLRPFWEQLSEHEQAHRARAHVRLLTHDLRKMGINAETGAYEGAA